MVGGGKIKEIPFSLVSFFLLHIAFIFSYYQYLKNEFPTFYFSDILLMKHSTLLLTLLTTPFLLTACGPSSLQTEQPTSPQTDLTTTIPLTTETSTGLYAYTRQMPKPLITEMTNRTAMNDGFSQERTTGHTFTSEEVEHLQNYCFTRPEAQASFVGYNRTKPLEKSDIIAGNTITFTGLRESEALLNLSAPQKQQVATRGRTIVEIQQLKERPLFDYSKESAIYPG
jgi:hypothetical protein